MNKPKPRLRTFLYLALLLALAATPAAAQTTFFCDFESYAPGANINGQPIGSGTWTSTGLVAGDQAIVSTDFAYDGAKSLLIADNGNNRPRATANFVTAGFIPAAAPRGTVLVAVREDPNDGTAADGFTLNLSGHTLTRDPTGSGKFVFSLTGGAFSLNVPFSTDTYTYTPGQWNKLEFDFDDVAKTTALYINGGYAGMLAAQPGGTANHAVIGVTLGTYSSNTVGDKLYFDPLYAEFTAPPTAPWRSTLYPENWTPGFTDADGRFLHDFSYAGYHRGEIPVPSIQTNIIDATATPYLADNTGTVDATAAIQAAIDAAGAAGGGVVYLPPGTYKVSPPTGALHSLRIASDNVVLRGAGTDQTFILNTSTKMRMKKVILVQRATATDWFADNSSTNTTPLSRDIIDPTVRIPVTSVAGFSVGDLIIVRNNLTSRFVAELGHTGLTGWTSFGNRPGLVVAFARRIVSIDAPANELIVDVPTRFRLLTVDSARVTKPVTPMISEVGIEDLSIGMTEYDPAAPGFGFNDYDTPGKAAYDMHQSFAIFLQSAENCWVRRVHTFKPAGNTTGAHVLSNALKLSNTRLTTVDSCRLSFAQYRGEGGNGYMITLEGQEALVSDCYTEAGRHNVSLGKMHASGNVYLRLYSKDSRYASDFHQYLSMSNLFDNATCDGDMIESRFRVSEGNPRQGQTSTQSVFWNTRGLKYGTSTDGTTSLRVVNSHQFERGYVIGTQGPAPAVVSTDFVEGVGRGADLVPASLYLDQLSRRSMPATVTLGNLSHTYDGQPKAATATTVPAGLNVVFTYDGSTTAPVDAGNYAVVATVDDPRYVGSATGTLIIAKATATVALGNLTQSHDGTPKSVTVTTAPAGLNVFVTFNGATTAPSAIGQYAVVATVLERNYEGGATGTLAIVDTTPPTLSSLTASPSELWPANHKLVNVQLTAVVSDAGDPAPRVRIISVSSNEPANGNGDGNTEVDWEITGDLTLKLRAERAGGGAGRIYTITVEARDAAGNASTRDVTVTVPHNR